MGGGGKGASFALNQLLTVARLKLRSFIVLVFITKLDGNLLIRILICSLVFWILVSKSSLNASRIQNQSK